MIGQAELDRLAHRAAGSLSDAREIVDADMLLLPERRALIAIADQLALANALAAVRLAREAGES